MLRYLFTNDLRISTLDASMREAAEMFITNTVPTAAADKSKNNNILTLGFYFCLKKGSKCSYAAASGNVRKVVLNFVKKFQFPNPRTPTSLNDAKADGIQLAPMRSILKLLYLFSMNEGDEGYLSMDEIRDFIFYNETVALNPNPNLIDVYTQIKNFRMSGVPAGSIIPAKDRVWKEETRQIREMTKILTWSGCVIEDQYGNYKFQQDKLLNDDKAELLDILLCNSYWQGDTPEDYYKYMDLDESEAEVMFDIPEKLRVKGATNVLLYGVPGSGKSYIIKNEICKDVDMMERLVFHPDYSYSDFVGQILPRIDGDRLNYVFTPGPFTKMLKRAVGHPDKMFYLVIEEINRGNAPAIFGEIFQLLDRDENGRSEYGITNYDIAYELFGNPDRTIFIPSNMSILATMNTSDQNVYTLDTAFQRRWNMRLIENDVSKAEHADQNILNTKITWQNFVETINRVVVDNSANLASSEDKRLGAYFVKEAELKYNDNENNSTDEDDIKRAKQENARFPEKVIKYLWDDVFKYSREEVFDERYHSLEEVIVDFEQGKRFGVFKLNFENDTILSDAET